MAPHGDDMSQFLTMMSACLRAEGEADIIDAALDALPALSGATAVAVAQRGPDGSLLLPESWPADVGIVTHHELPGHAGTLAFAWDDEPSSSDGLDVALAVLDTIVSRDQLQTALDDLNARVDNAQHLASMGDYDWHIASNTNRWSDELYRIYGHEPQSFNASYERFLEMVHPDDRERIAGIHQEAYRTGEPYQMIERIVRPDGEVRHLASNGQVLMDESGTPLRFRGTCIDITERVLAEEAREKLAERMLEDRIRRRQAMELNDSVVQELVTASYALELGDIDLAASRLAQTLAAARDMMGDLLEASGGELPGPGDMVRTAPARLPDDARGPTSTGETRW